MLLSYSNSKGKPMVGFTEFFHKSDFSIKLEVLSLKKVPHSQKLLRKETFVVSKKKKKENLVKLIMAVDRNECIFRGN